MSLFSTIKKLFRGTDRHDHEIINDLKRINVMRPTDTMLECEESARMKTAAGMFFLLLYYTGCQTYIRFPRALPTELKGIAV